MQLGDITTFTLSPGITVDESNNVYVTAALTNFGVNIQKYDVTGTPVDLWRTSTTNGIESDRAGRLYAASLQGTSVDRLTDTGNLLSSWRASGSEPGRLLRPDQVAVDASGAVYVANGSDFGGGFHARINRLDGDLVYQTELWQDLEKAPQYWSGLAVNSQGNVFASNPDRQRIVKFDANGVGLDYWTVNNPQALAVDDSGNVYVMDGNTGDIEKYSSNGDQLMTFSVTMDPDSLAVDRYGNVFSELNNTVYKYSANGSLLDQFTISGITGSSYLTDVDEFGNLYLTHNDREIMRVCTGWNRIGYHWWCRSTSRDSYSYRVAGLK